MADQASVHRPWCGASEYPAVVATAGDAVCCPLDLRNAGNRPADPDPMRDYDGPLKDRFGNWDR